MKIKSIHVAIPTRSATIRAEIAACLFDWMSDPAPIARAASLHFAFGISIVSVARDLCAKAFLDSKHTHVLWIDDDMGPSYGNIKALISKAVESESHFFSAACCLRNPRPVLAGIPANPEDIHARRVAEMESVGLACALVSREVFEAIAPSCADYEVPNQPQKTNLKGFFLTDGLIGEDTAFCRRVRSAGFKIHLDPRNLVPHIGPAKYPLTLET